MMTDISRGFPRDPQFFNGATRPVPFLARESRSPVVVSRAAGMRARRASWDRASASRLATWLALFVLLNTGDVISTYAGLNSGMREGNPLLSALLLGYGFSALIAYKVLMVLAVTIGVFVLRTFSKEIASATLWICNGIVCVVVAMNILQFVPR